MLTLALNWWCQSVAHRYTHLLSVEVLPKSEAVLQHKADKILKFIQFESDGVNVVLMFFHPRLSGYPP